MRPDFADRHRSCEIRIPPYLGSPSLVGPSLPSRDDPIDIVRFKNTMRPIHHLPQTARIDEKNTVALVFGIFSEQPQRHGDHRRTEKFVGKLNDALHDPCFDHGRPNRPLLRIAGERRRVRHHHGGPASLRELRLDVLKPGEVGLVPWRRTVPPPRVVGRISVGPAGQVERRVGEDDVVSLILVDVVPQSIGRTRTHIRLEAVDGQVQARQGQGPLCESLPMKRQLRRGAATLFDILSGTDEEPARTAAWVLDSLP